VLKDYVDVFSEILGLPPSRDVSLSIDLIPAVVRVSKEPYKMSTLELREL